MRTDGRPSAPTVASAVASGCAIPAASASPYQTVNWRSGSSSRSLRSITMSVTGPSVEMTDRRFNAARMVADTRRPLSPLVLARMHRYALRRASPTARSRPSPQRRQSPVDHLGSALVAVTRGIDIRTEIPGPRSRELLARELEAVAHPLIVHLPVFAAEAEGATITDVDGNRFIDFAGGVGVVNVGHGHPRVVEAVQEQSTRFLHTDYTVIAYEGYVELAERLGALAPVTGPTRAAVFHAGTEAVENP